MSLIKVCFTSAILLFSNFLFGNDFPKAKYETVNETKLAYYEMGQGETIVLLHGWPQTSYVWRDVMPLLSKNYHVIAIDLPGMGESDFVDNYSTENVAGIIHDFLIKKNLTKVNLVGHDLGTWVALTYSIRFEDNLKSLILMDAGIPGLMDEKVFQPSNAGKIWQFYFHGIDDLPEMLTQGKEDTYLNWYFETKSFNKNGITPTDKKVYFKAYKKAGRMKAGFDYYRNFSVNAAYNKKFIQKINVPILAIGGEYALAKNVGEAVVPYSSHLQNISMKNSGHYIAEEQPQEFVDILVDFLRKKI